MADWHWTPNPDGPTQDLLATLKNLDCQSCSPYQCNARALWLTEGVQMTESSSTRFPTCTRSTLYQHRPNWAKSPTPSYPTGRCSIFSQFLYSANAACPWCTIIAKRTHRPSWSIKIPSRARSSNVFTIPVVYMDSHPSRSDIIIRSAKCPKIRNQRSRARSQSSTRTYWTR